MDNGTELPLESNIFSVFYLLSNGRIAQSAFGQEHSLRSLCRSLGLEFLQVMSNVDNSKFFIQDGEVVPRPENPAKIEGSVLSDLPASSCVDIEYGELILYPEDSSIQLDIPYKVNIRVSCWPFKDVEFSYAGG